MSDLPVSTKNIRQANVFTEARYDFSLLEKRIVYYIIQYIQDRMGQNIDVTLFGDPILRIPTREIVTGENYRQLKASCKSLDGKRWEMEADGKFKFFGFGSIEYLGKESGIVEIELSQKLIPYLLELARGYTVYDLNVALSLKSPYSQRIYEFCAQFRSTGVWRISIEDFKKRLKIDDSPTYNGASGNSNLKSKILEKAKKEIKTIYDKGECDLYFIYTLKKTGREFTDLEFKIFSTKNPHHEPVKEESRQFVFNFFRDHFREEREKGFVRKAMNGLFNKNAYDSFRRKLEPKLEKYYDGKYDSNDLKALTRHILLEDFQIQ